MTHPYQKLHDTMLAVIRSEPVDSWDLRKHNLISDRLHSLYKEFDWSFLLRQLQVMRKQGLIQFDRKTQKRAAAPEHVCKYCGAPSYVDPSDQVPPADACHSSDHGEPA